MLSIITPCYYSSNKILNLLNALNNQTSEDFELICVEDSANDVERQYLNDILNRYDFKFKLICNHSNIGAGLSRNEGIGAASGDYITFVDSDDYVSKDFVRTIVAIAAEQTPDCICFDATRVLNHKNKALKMLPGHSEGMVGRDEFILDSKTCVCGKAWSISIIIDNHIEFSDLKRFEDWKFNVEAILCCKKIWYIEKDLYYYIDQNDSQVHKYYGKGHLYALEVHTSLEDKLSKEYTNILEFLYLRSVIYLYLKENAKSLSSAEIASGYSSLIAKYPNLMMNVYINRLSLVQRIMISLANRRLFVILKIIMYRFGE